MKGFPGCKVDYSPYGPAARAPAAALAVAAVASVASTAVTAASAIGQGKFAEGMGEYNAAMSEDQAKNARAAADLKEQQHREQTKSLLSSQRAAVGASGIDLEGSSVSFMEETAADAELDSLLIRHSGTVEEAQYRAQAAADRAEGKAAKRAGYISATASVLNGASKVASMYAGKQ